MVYSCVYIIQSHHIEKHVGSNHVDIITAITDNLIITRCSRIHSASDIDTHSLSYYNMLSLVTHLYVPSACRSPCTLEVQLASNTRN